MMTALDKRWYRQADFVAATIGAGWGISAAITVTVALALMTGAGVAPYVLISLLAGAVCAVYVLRMQHRLEGTSLVVSATTVYLLIFMVLTLGAPFTISLAEHTVSQAVAFVVMALFTVWPLSRMLVETPKGWLDRHEFESAIINFMYWFGYLFFIIIVAVPFYVMVMTSLKSQQALLANPLDFSLDLDKGFGLFRSYVELFEQFNFGEYLLTSFSVSVATVIVTLLFSVPGAYAVARLRFRGQAAMSRSILLIYMVPMIVLALPIYIGFSMLGLRNSLFGILLIYPVTTIPVALYMLQGYFRGLPAEVEEAGLMDGLSRLKVILKITLPLSLPAMASVSLYVFMIAWNEFLLAFMLLDDPSKFTLTRGVAMLNSSEIPRQHLMAGAVIATVPIMMIFLGLERFMVKGLTAGSVK
ncbi:Inner membrane ABC transporter permease protein YcjP [Grimontia celer]|uniref:Inner membrane ABC transporter permease protein YcjP n=1 Tax=Grimontia celer TaxID=1796497 RepID=A0A128F1H5_9GAMM|nr:carbohydrate ABC transporter permease [Grimontia celer]CZF80637.1 Inner membrane ABC transporter permease protein YcjP [Grimontia celer]